MCPAPRCACLTNVVSKNTGVCQKERPRGIFDTPSMSACASGQIGQQDEMGTGNVPGPDAISSVSSFTSALARRNSHTAAITLRVNACAVKSVGYAVFRAVMV